MPSDDLTWSTTDPKLLEILGTPSKWASERAEGDPRSVREHLECARILCRMEPAPCAGRAVLMAIDYHLAVCEKKMEATDARQS